jgi:kynureninase
VCVCVCARLVGADVDEVALMNGLTVNIHILFVCCQQTIVIDTYCAQAHFYRPTHERYKIVLEKQAFPSDHYAVESQIRWHGYDVDESMILLEPRPVCAGQ